MSEHNLPATIGISDDEFLQAAADNEDFGRQDQVIPFLRILQPLSPQVQEGEPLYVPGAKVGMFWNAASNTIHDGNKGILMIPIAHQYNYVEWIPRNEGGGFVKDWKADESGWQQLCDADQKTAYQPRTKDGHVIARARHFFIYQFDPDTADIELSILPFVATSLRIAKSWSSMMLNAPKVRVGDKPVVPPYHYYVYHLQSERVTNAKGTWYLPKIRHHIKDNKYQTIFDMPNGNALWKMAGEFKESLREGKIQIESQAGSDQMADSGNNNKDEDTF